MNSIRVVGIIGIFIIIVVFAISIPEDVNNERLQRGADVLGVSAEEIIRESEQQLIVQNIVAEEPDYVIDEVKFYVDEIPAVNVTSMTVARHLELERTITFDDGSIDRDVIKSAIFEIPKLDFVSIKDNSTPLSNGKINFKLYVNIDKEIQSAEGSFTIFFGENRSIVKAISPKLSQSDVIDKKLVIFSEDVDLKSLLSQRSEGVYQLELRLEKFFIIFKDNSREYVEPLNVLYSISIEKNLSKSIVKDETGNFIKIFDSDVPISVSANAQSVTGVFCNSYYRTGGCADTYSKTTYIPAPALGSVIITDKNGIVVASKPPMGAGSCVQIQDRFVSGASQCIGVTGGGGSLIFNAQRGQSYTISVSDPLRSWIVTVPEPGGSFSYSCIESKTSVRTGVTLSGIEIYGIQSNGRVCNFP